MTDQMAQDRALIIWAKNKARNYPGSITVVEAMDEVCAALARRLTDAEQAQRWATFLADWVDYNHGKGESDRAWEEFLAAERQRNHAAR